MSYLRIWEVKGGTSGELGLRWEGHALGLGAPVPGHVSPTASITSPPCKPAPHFPAFMSSKRLPHRVGAA